MYHLHPPVSVSADRIGGLDGWWRVKAHEVGRGKGTMSLSPRIRGRIWDYRFKVGLYALSSEEVNFSAEVSIGEGCPPRVTKSK